MPDRQSIPTAVTGKGRIVTRFVDQSGIAYLQYTTTTDSGNSGSPIANACAEVVGLHSPGGSETSYDRDAVNPTKFNQSIAGREIVLFLRRLVRRIGRLVEAADSPREVGG